MAEQHGYNTTSSANAFVVIFTLQALAGMWINAFIVAASCAAWLKKKSMNSNEKILLFLGCFRFWYLCTMWIYTIISVVLPQHILDTGISITFAIFLCFFNSSNLWTSACLYAFYCIKIANFRHHFFIYLKARIDGIVPWLLLSSVVLSLLNCSPFFGIINEGNGTSSSFTTQGVFWEINEKIRKHYNTIILVCTSGFSMAFVMVTFSAFLLLFSLCRHKHRMQTSSARSLSMDVHIKAMKSLLSFFFVYSINYITLMSLVYYDSEESLLGLLLLFLLYVFPIVHSLILIFSNPKLERILLRILSCAKCKDCTRQPSDTLVLCS